MEGSSSACQNKVTSPETDFYCCTHGGGEKFPKGARISHSLLERPNTRLAWHSFLPKKQEVSPN